MHVLLRFKKKIFLINIDLYWLLVSKNRRFLRNCFCGKTGQMLALRSLRDRDATTFDWGLEKAGFLQKTQLAVFFNKTRVLSGLLIKTLFFGFFEEKKIEKFYMAL